jgi:uncharacterized coiled-coil protein SlyX
MRHRALELRLQELELRQVFLKQQIDEAKTSGAEKSAIGELMTQYVDVSARMDEIRQWQKTDAESPKYGTQVRVDGMWRPKLPVFGSMEKALESLTSPDGGFGLSPSAVRAARERQTQGDTQEAIRALDGRSPLLPEDERKPFNTTI